MIEIKDWFGWLQIIVKNSKKKLLSRQISIEVDVYYNIVLYNRTHQNYHPTMAEVVADYDSALEGVLEDTSRLIIKQEVEIMEAAVQVR